METEQPKKVYITSIETNRVTYLIMATDKGICWAGFQGAMIEDARKWAKQHLGTDNVSTLSVPKFLQDTALQLKLYLAGDPMQFTGPFDFYGTPFQQLVWKTFIDIPYGQTKSYKEIAQLIGKPKAIRAVGAACGANPIAILVPCHRVVGTNGKLTGYAGGMESKNFLLNLEKKKAQQSLF